MQDGTKVFTGSCDKTAKMWDLNSNQTVQIAQVSQGSHRLEKYLNLEGFLEKSLKINSALKSTGKSLKSIEKSLNSTIFFRIEHC